MAKCFGKYPRNVDEKGRIIVPANFRENLGAAIYLVQGKNNRLSVYSKEEWDKYFEKYEDYDDDDEAAEAKASMIADRVADSKYDKQGRLKMSDECLKYAGISDEVVVIGVGKRIDIWKPETYDEYKNSTK